MAPPIRAAIAMAGMFRLDRFTHPCQVKAAYFPLHCSAAYVAAEAQIHGVALTGGIRRW